MATDYSYLGSGKISIREVGAAAGLLEVGNCSNLSFSVTEDVKELKDYTQPGGGTQNEVRRITAVEMSMTCHDLSPENLARALYGSVDAITTTPVVGEAIGAAYAGGVSLFAKMPNPTPAPVIGAVNGAAAGTRANTAAVALNAYLVPAVANGFYYKVTTAGTTAGAPPVFPTVAGATVTDGTAVLTCMGRITLTANTDYTVTAGGVRFISGGSFTAGETFTAGYTPYAASTVQALTNSAKEYEVVFEGLNEARSGKPAVVQVFRAKLGALQNLALLGEDYAALEQTGKILKDTTKVGVGVSQYFKASVAA